MTEFNVPHLESEDFQALLSGQLAHDSRCHRDIQGLALGPRLQHLALHFAKYVGRIAESGGASNQLIPLRTLIDCLIISLSACNALGIDSKVIFGTAKRPLHGPSNVSQLALELAAPVGRLAKVCEALDHLEELPYASQMRQAIAQIVGVLLVSWPVSHSTRICSDVRARWLEIESARIV
jgi:hypothetical protein